MCAQSQSLLSTIANVHTCYGLRGDKRKFLMALLTAYFDESGVTSSGNTCVVAGFIGNDAQWASLAADWIPAIKPRSNLHMRKLKWKRFPGKTAELLAKLGPIPHKYNLKPIAVSMKWDDYNAILKGKVDEHFKSPYVLCCLSAVGVVLSEIAKDNKVYFVFDRQEGTRKKTMNAIRDTVFNWFGADSRVTGLEFMKHTDTVCLDPADYLAYIVRERAMDQNSMRAKLGESIIGESGYGGIIPAQYLEVIARENYHPRSLRHAVESLALNPYFRGPKGTPAGV